MNDPIEQGEALYQIVPALYRTRDTGDLKKYFEACGLLLDQIRATLPGHDHPDVDRLGCRPVARAGAPTTKRDAHQREKHHRE